LAIAACKKIHQPPPQFNTGNILQVELKMPAPWKKIVIGPTQSIEYLNVPQRFSMFMTGESTAAHKPYPQRKSSIMGESLKFYKAPKPIVVKEKELII